MFALVPVAALLLFAEVTIRLCRAPLHFGSFRELRIDLFRRGYPAVPDAKLGYAPRPGAHGEENHWDTTVTIDAQGMRENGAAAPPPGPVVAVVGDSFTFGDQVDDDETWPAHLQRILGQRVVNGGVFGYSFVQSILRAERMLEQYPVDTLVVSLIPDDLTRSEYCKRYVPLPWFDVQDGALVPRFGPPDPELGGGSEDERDLKNALGYSALLDALLANTAKRWWIEDEKQVTAPRLAGRGGEIGRLLLDRIARICRDRGVELLLVLQGERSTSDADALLAHARERGVATLDLVQRFLAAEQQDPGVKERWFDGHMTDAGNRWAAEQIAAALRVPETR